MKRWPVTLLFCLCSLSLATVEAAELTVDSVVISLIAEAEVPAEEAGRLAEVVAQEGQRVKAGELLAKINERDALLEVAKARIAVEQATEQAANDVKLRRAQQTLKLAKLELSKSEDANKEIAKIVSATQIEKLKIDVANAELEIEQAQNDLSTARRALDVAKNELAMAERSVERRRVLSPIDGVVIEVRRNLGEWLKPGEPVLRVVRDDRLRAIGFLHVDQLRPDLLGRAVQLHVRQGGQNTVVPATITFVSPEANPINGQVKFWADIDNADHQLRAGLAAQMTIPESAGAK